MLKKIGSAVVAVAPLSAFAAVPADVTTALADMKTDTLAVATAFVVLAVVVAAFMWMRKPAK
jgi:hypothetical protein